VVGVTHNPPLRPPAAGPARPAASAAAGNHAPPAAGSAALLLSTCNRCEIYWTGDLDLEAWFRDFSLSRDACLGEEFLRLDGEEAIRHLLEVTAGLDSQILGETEVLGQVRRAYDAARAAGTTNRLIDAILSAALVAGRRVRRETILGRHPASVSSAAVDVAASALGSLADARALVLGAGEVAEGVLKALHGRTAGTALVNRRPERAAALASAWGAVSGGWDELDALLAAADLVFVATGAVHPLIAATRLAEAVGPRRRALAVFDLSVPRNVEPSARSIPGIRLFDLDELQRLRCPAEGFASPAIDHARTVLGQELERLATALRARAAAPRLAELHRLGARLAEEEAETAIARLGDLGDREQQVVREMAERLVRRVLYPVSRTVRAAGDTQDGASGR
jgi:glutamyl-tRNA reductase